MQPEIGEEIVGAVRWEVLRRITAGSKRGVELVAVLLACFLACCTQSASDSEVCSPFAGLPTGAAAYEEKDWGSLDLGGRQRVLVLTDFGNEPDDAQSLVRFLVYANEFDIEGILATTSTWLRDEVQIDGVREHVEAYAQVRDNLLVHTPGYPAVETLSERVHPCQAVYGMQGVGPGMDSEGADHILRVLGQADERPIWISMWGGANCLAGDVRVAVEIMTGELGKAAFCWNLPTRGQGRKPYYIVNIEDVEKGKILRFGIMKSDGDWEQLAESVTLEMAPQKRHDWVSVEIELRAERIMVKAGDMEKPLEVAADFDTNGHPALLVPEDTQNRSGAHFRALQIDRL